MLARFFCTCVLFILWSCKNSNLNIENPGTWSVAPEFGGPARSGAFEFTIQDLPEGPCAFVGSGYGGANGIQYLKDVWMFNLNIGIWTQVAPFPGIGRELSIAFSIGHVGYVGTGYNRYYTTKALPDSANLGDFWAFYADSTTMTIVNGTQQLFLGKWKQLHNFRGSPRYAAVAFTANGLGYVGTGYDGNYPGTDAWELAFPMPADKREGAMSLTFDGEIYVFGGDSNGLQEFDLWRFDPVAVSEQQAWVNVSEAIMNGNYYDFKAAVRRSSACAFTLNNVGYVVCGTISSQPTTLCYQFNPINGDWVKMTAYERSARSQAACFVLGTNSSAQRGFVTTGAVGTKQLDNMDEWLP
jgi:hypothetical protein